MSVTRKEAIRQFKEAAVPRGVYLLRCVRSGTTWVGPSRNLKASRNGMFMSLRTGSHMDKELQKEWNEHGEDAFDYLVLEEFDPELPAMALTDTLKSRAQFWRDSLNARQLL